MSADRPGPRPDPATGFPRTRTAKLARLDEIAARNERIKAGTATGDDKTISQLHADLNFLLSCFYLTLAE